MTLAEAMKVFPVQWPEQAGSRSAEHEGLNGLPSLLQPSTNRTVETGTK
jgi:hypothetical protein